MKILLSTYQGLENLLISRLKSLGINKIEHTSKHTVITDITKNQLKNLPDKLKIITDIKPLVFYFKYKSLEDIKANIESYNFKNILIDNFVVRINRNQNKEIQTTALEKEIGGILYKKYKRTVSLSNPSITIVLDIIESTCFVCYIKENMQIKKRLYKIKTHPQDISGPLAAGILYLSGYKKYKTLIDPYANIGTLLIEATLMSKDKVYGIESSYKTIKDLEINASVAKVKDKIVIYNKIPKKLNKKFDFIITQPPKNLDLKDSLKNIYNLSKKTSVISLILKDTNLKNINEKDYKLNISKSHKIIVGKTIYDILICNQKKP